MSLTDREKDGMEALSGVMKSALSLIPALGQAIAGYDAYKQSMFKRHVEKIMRYLADKVDSLEGLFSDEWVKTEEGKQFSNKVLDCALDAQMEEKQELFVNTLINGIRNKDISTLEKLKFVDMLRHLSLASLSVLADMHKIFSDRVRRPGKPGHRMTTDTPALIDLEDVVRQLSSTYHPYLIESSIEEMKSIGLFSPHLDYFKMPDGKYGTSGYYPQGNIAYTDFTSNFVEFISDNSNLQRLQNE
jgi:hypothetical protein